MDSKHQGDYLFRREDESPDALFYRQPRFETHIDDATIEALTEVYLEFLLPGSDILDLMSSWISHLPMNIVYNRVSGLGMNLQELRANPRLDDFVVHDLNESPYLPYAESSFDAVVVAVSVQYLIKPYQVFRSIAEVLKPGGISIISISHRLFPSKAIQAFFTLPLPAKGELVESYFVATGCFESTKVIDRSPQGADPLWIVVARRA
jgi:SAM-dependent methyltransferase